MWTSCASFELMRSVEPAMTANASAIDGSLASREDSIVWLSKVGVNCVSSRALLALASKVPTLRLSALAHSPAMSFHWASQVIDGASGTERR